MTADDDPAWKHRVEEEEAGPLRPDYHHHSSSLLAVFNWSCYRFTARLNGTSAADAEDGEPTSHFNHLKLQGAKSPFIITISLYWVLKKPWMWDQQASQNNTKTSKLNLYFWLAFGLFLQILHILSFRRQTMLDSNFSNSASRQRPHRMNDYS